MYPCGRRRWPGGSDSPRRLYRQEVLKEQPSEPVLQIQGLGGGRKKQELQEVVHKPTV